MWYKHYAQHTLQAIWGFGLMESLACICYDLANPRMGLI